jgi:excisionase family DNA binding protein
MTTRSEPRRLMTVDEIAELLRVRRSWIYARTRLRGPDRLPHTRVGRYIRFSQSDLQEIIWRSNPEKTTI